MPLYETPNLTAGIDEAVIGTAEAVTMFIPLFLFFIFGTVFISGVISQKRRLGTADVPMWATIASLSTMLISLPMTLTAGLINITTLSIIVSVTILSGFWLFTSKSRNEV